MEMWRNAKDGLNDRKVSIEPRLFSHGDTIGHGGMITTEDMFQLSHDFSVMEMRG
jgi:hypothetical protein